MQQIAEDYAKPVHAELGPSFARTNDFNDKFFLRWGKIDFEIFHGDKVNLKVILKVYRKHNICETYIIDTDAFDIKWNHHKRHTRSFYIHQIGRRRVGKECLRLCRSRWSPYH